MHARPIGSLFYHATAEWKSKTNHNSINTRKSERLLLNCFEKFKRNLWSLLFYQYKELCPIEIGEKEKEAGRNVS